MKKLIQDILDWEDEGVPLERECAHSDVCVHLDVQFHYSYKLHIGRITEFFLYLKQSKVKESTEHCFSCSYSLQ